MPTVNKGLLRQPFVLWSCCIALLCFDFFAVARGGYQLFFWALGLTAAFAILGIGLGISAARNTIRP